MLVRRRAVEIGATRLFGELFYFFDGEQLARFLRQFRRGWREGARGQIFHFPRVEPYKMAEPANIDSDVGVVGEVDLDHQVSAGRTLAARLAFTSDRVKPKRIDRFRRKSVAQQFDTDGAAAAGFAAPKDSIRSARFF